MKNLSFSELQYRDFINQVSDSKPVTYTRPSEWLAMPTILSSEQKMCALYAIFDGYNAACFSVTCSGNFTVDWGDGSSPQTYTSGTISYSYNYSSFSAQPVTSYGYKQAIITVTPAAGKTITAIAFNVVPAGRPTSEQTNWLDIRMSFPSMTSLTLRGSSTYIFGMLQEITIINSALSSYLDLFRNLRNLRKVVLENTGSPTSAGNMFNNCSNLILINSFKTNTLTDCTSIFSTCYSLQQTPFLDFSSCTTFTNGFSNCRNLKQVEIKTTSALLSTDTMFSNCQSLVEINKFDVSGVTNNNSMFNNCYSLESIPDFNWQAATSMTSVYNNCYSLKNVPPQNWPAATSATSTFAGCSGLQFASINGPLLTNTTGTFNNCSVLKSVYLNAPLLQVLSQTFLSCSNFEGFDDASVIGGTSTPTITSIATAFSGCSSMKKWPVMNLATCTTLGQAFNTCPSLPEPMPLYNTALATTANNMIPNCTNLRIIPALDFNSMTSGFFNSTITGLNIVRFQPTGIKFSFSLANQQLDAAALDEVYTNLGTASGSQTITVTGNPGTTGDNPSIATAKGWTVVGS